MRISMNVTPFSHTDVPDMTDNAGAAFVMRPTGGHPERVRGMPPRVLDIVAHEMRNLLTPLGLQVQLLTTGRFGPLSDAQARAISLIERNLDKLGHLVMDVRALERLGPSQFPTSPRVCDLAAVVREAVEASSVAADAAGVRLETHVPAAVPLRADPERVGQVLLNLISNALKYTSDASCVRVTCDVGPLVARVAVTDAGVGLRPDQRARLFAPFAQVLEPATQRSGTGIGLFVSKRIVEAHGGAIGVDSAGPGAGSTFWFTLPREGAYA